MPDILSKENKFDPVLVTELFDKVKGKSSLAALCDQTFSQWMMKQISWVKTAKRQGEALHLHL